MSQVYLYFEKIKKIEMDQHKMNAIVFANCLMGTSESHDASAARQKSRRFQEFMDSLSWNKFSKKAREKQEPKSAEKVVKQLFGGIGIVPFRERKKK